MTGPAHPAGDGPVLLVLRALGLGDALTGVPALRGLRRAFPGHRLVLAGPAGPGEWLRGLGLVDEVMPTAGLAPFPRPAGSAEGDLIAVNLHGRGPQSHHLLRALDPRRLIAFREPDGFHDSVRAGPRDPEVAAEGPHWSADEHEVDRWCRLARWVGGPCEREDLRLPLPERRFRDGPYVVVHPGAASPSRRWPPSRWASVVRWLRAAGHEVLVTGGPAERELAADVARDGARSLAGAQTLPALAETVAGADLLICGDTGVAHLATAYRTPSVLLFGPTSPRHWGPAIDPDRHEVLWHGARTGPGDPHGRRLDPALALITVDEVVAALDRRPGQVAVARD